MPARSSFDARPVEGDVMTIQARQAAHRLGHVAEWRAVWRLRLAGYSILARRYKTKLGEIDIVVRRGGILAFVEVKARADSSAATDALGGRQFGRVARAASLYLARHPHYAAAFGALRRGAGGRALAAPSARCLAAAGVMRTIWPRPEVKLARLERSLRRRWTASRSPRGGADPERAASYRAGRSCAVSPARRGDGVRIFPTWCAAAAPRPRRSAR